MGNTKLAIGTKFGRLTIIEICQPHVQKNGRKRTVVLCQCECGNVKRLKLEHLQNGNTRSCGCLHKEIMKIKKHGLMDHPLYSVWNDLKKRCYNKKNNRYKDWGFRGIEICDEWKTNFKCFYDWCLKNGWEEKLQIDRENNNGNYEPSNCRFITAQINNENKRLIQTNNKTGYRGVFYRKRDFCYGCCVGHKNKNVYSKEGFKTAKEAAIARDIFCIKNDIPFALNFPELSFGWCL